MNLLFVGSMAGYFFILCGMHLLIQGVLIISKNVYIGVAISAFIVMLISFYLAYTDIRYKY